MLSPAAAEQQYLAAQLAQISQAIQRQLAYPAVARRLGWQGRVMVSFVVCLDGRIVDLQIVESSGYKVLDNSAITTIEQAAPFPLPPVRARLVVPVVYRLG
jgi:protein TonB